MNKNEILGKYCRKFRMDVLNKTLKEVEQDDDIQLLSAFEHGRSTNYKHVFKYIRACDNEEQVNLFMETLKFVSEYWF